MTQRRANLDGRLGVAVGYTEHKTASRHELIFDPDTGEVIGERYVDKGVKLPGMPDGISGWTSTRVKVVDRAP